MKNIQNLLSDVIYVKTKVNIGFDEQTCKNKGPCGTLAIYYFIAFE